MARFVGVLALLVACADDPPPFLIPDGGMIERCMGTGIECAGDIELECEGGETQSMRDCADEGLSCISGRGCQLCLPGSISCDGEFPLYCNSAGNGWDVGDACEPGLRCSARGCLDLCADAEASASYIGCEYWPTTASNSQLGREFDFAIVIANPQLVPAAVIVEHAGEVDASVIIPPGELETIRLPWVDALKGGEIGEEESAIVRDGAYRLRSDVPVTVYQFNPLEYRIETDCADEPPEGRDGRCYSYSNDASLLLPTHVLTGSYIGLARPSMVLEIPNVPPTVIGSPGFLTITAVEDDTEVEVTARAYISASSDASIPALAPGETAMLSLDAGDVVQLLSAIPESCPGEWVEEDSTAGTFRYCDAGAQYDLTGTELRSTRPIAVLGGHNCTFVPFDRWACDHLEEALFPVEAWGRSFLVGATRPIRGEPNLMRIVSAADGNQIEIDPVSTGALTLDRGRYFEIPLSAGVHVTGTQPLAIVQFLVGQDYGGLGAAGIAGVGDPSMSLAIPNEQYRTEYTFLAPATYSTSYINVSASLGSSILLNGRLLGELAPIGESGAGLIRVEVGSGVHRLESASPFGVVVYGFGSYTSYMYPAGLDLREIAPPI